jgi:hypothetical protein
VTDQRILFQPNRFDVATGKKPREYPLTSVTGVEAVDRNVSELAGGLRERLGIRTSNGVEVFVVNDLAKKIAKLREYLSEGSVDSPSH